MVQSKHSFGRFAYHHYDKFKHWMETSEYLVSLSIENEEKLQDLYYKLQDNGADVVAFKEPDIDNQLTSICYYGTPELRKITNKLELSLSKLKIQKS